MKIRRFFLKNPEGIHLKAIPPEVRDMKPKLALEG